MSDVRATRGDPPPIAATSALGRFQFAGFTLDLDGRTLVDASGREVSLRRMEFDLLATLVRSPGRVLSRDHLLGAVARRRAEPFDRSVDVMVGRLRKKIALDPASPRLILTVAGAGYKFAARAQLVAAASEPVPEPAPQRPAERRQLTILHCGLAEAASLSARLDPEDLHRVIAAFEGCCIPIVVGFGGVVARRQADGVLAHFGYPQAHENDAERAIRAGLGAVAAAAKLQSCLPVTIAAKVGIATGNVLIGDMLGEHEHAAFGEAPDLAARLASHAAAGSVTS